MRCTGIGAPANPHGDDENEHAGHETSEAKDDNDERLARTVGRGTGHDGEFLARRGTSGQSLWRRRGTMYFGPEEEQMQPRFDSRTHGPDTPGRELVRARSGGQIATCLQITV